MRKVGQDLRASASRSALLLQLRSAVALAVAIGVPAGGQASAQEAQQSSLASGQDEVSTSGLGDIIVVARKRAEDVQDVPDAISVLPREIIEAGDLEKVEDFVDLVPNASFNTDSETSSEVSIRGSARNIADEDPSVGIYRDGVYVGGLLFSTATFYDLERVEVLRGPQAALYGRNAVGGAVNVITRRPSFDLNGYGEVQIGTKSRQELRGAFNAPLVDDKLAVRVSGLLINQDDGFDRIVNQDVFTDAEEIGSLRGRLLFTPSPDWEFLTTVEYVETDGGAPLLVPAPDSEIGFLDSEFTVEIPGTFPEDTDNQFRDWPTFREFDQFHAFQEVNWTTGAGTLSGIVSYRDASLSLSRDDDFTNFVVSGREYDASQESFFSELRFATSNIDDVDVLFGVNYLDEDLDLSYDTLLGGNFYGALGGVNLAEMYATGVTPPQFEAFGIPTGTPIDAIGLTPGATGLTGFLGDSFPLAFTNQQTLSSIAVFGDVTYEISPKFEIWGNARYTHDTKNIAFGQNFVDCPVACPEIVAFLLDGLDFEVNGTNRATFENVSLGGGINYRPTDSILAYAKIVEGFKAGGFNPIAATRELQPFDSEESISYEVGLKTELFDKRLRLNFAAFLQDRKGTLVEIQDPLIEVLELGVNAGKVRNKGIELEATAAPVDGLLINLAAGYLDAKFRDFEFGDVDFSGNRVPRTFKYSLSAIVTYERPITDEVNLFSYASYRNAWDGFTDNDNGHKMSNPELVDIRLGVTSNDGWRVNGFVDNLFDNRYTTLDIVGTRIPRGTFSPGRTYGIQISKEF